MAVPNLKKVQGNSSSTTSSNSITDSDTSLPLASDSNFAGEGMVIIDEGETTEEFSYATGKSGSSLTIPVANRGLEGSSAEAHDSGASVKGILTADMWNDIIDTLLEIFDQTTGKFVQLKDANGNEILKHTATASAVNEITLKNAATGNAPEIQATGDDTNIDLALKGKGTGGVKLGTGTVAVTDVLDEDDMASDSESAVPTQQSVKAYVDTEYTVPYVRVTLITTAQSIPNNSVEEVEWNNEQSDAFGFHDNSTNPERLTVPSGCGGVYVISAAMEFAFNVSGRRAMLIRKNGNTVGQQEWQANSNDKTYMSISAIIDLDAGDYITIGVFQSSGGSLDTGSLPSHNNVAMARLGNG